MHLRGKLSALLFVAACTVKAQQRTLLSSDDRICPSLAALNAFNHSVNGALIRVVPYGQPCYSATYDAEACKALAAQKGNDHFRLEIPAGVMYTNWEQTGSGSATAGCPVPDPKADGTAPDPVRGECSLGAMASYVVNASTVGDVRKTVSFASRHGLEFRIKNAGHDYMGRSTEENAFTLWTHHLKDTALVKDFVPEGCGLPPVDVVSAEPGLSVRELYKFTSDNGVVTVGGFDESVGATGGWLVGGGMGPLGPIFGMGVDNVVQFEVVTAAAEVLIVNECTNPDLFWALRGGGGAFAVVTRVWIRVYPAFDTVNTILGQILCSDASAYAKLVDAMVDLQLPLREQGQTGIWEVDSASQSAVLVFVAAHTNGTGHNATSDFQIFDPLRYITGCRPFLLTREYAGSMSWYDAYNGSIWPAVAAGSQVGVNLLDFSRIISYDLVRSRGGRQSIKDFILNLTHPFIWQNAVDGPARSGNDDDTSVHPAWNDAFGYMDVPVFGPWEGVTSKQKEDWLSIQENATKVFGTAAYYNEDYELEPEWKDSFFGANYERLNAIKQKWDPAGFFRCRQCVGSDEKRG